MDGSTALTGLSALRGGAAAARLRPLDALPDAAFLARFRFDSFLVCSGKTGPPAGVGLFFIRAPMRHTPPATSNQCAALADVSSIELENISDSAHSPQCAALRGPSIRMNTCLAPPGLMMPHCGRLVRSYCVKKTVTPTASANA